MRRGLVVVAVVWFLAVVVFSLAVEEGVIVVADRLAVEIAAEIGMGRWMLILGLGLREE